MNICFFGIYDREYSRNRVLIQGFEKNGYTVTHCNADPRIYRGIRKYVELVRAHLSLREKNFDMVLVAFPGHTVVWLARILFRRPIVFDVFVSLYNSNVEDRKKYGKHSIRGYRDMFLDWHSCILSNDVLLDTNAHIQYFVERYAISRKKFMRVFVSTTPNDFYPMSKKGEVSGDRFVVHFHGSFIPLQGVEYVLRASKFLETDPTVLIRVIGSGQEYDFMRDLARELDARNIEFVDRVPLQELKTYMNDAHVCLGIFGDTLKTNLVIPNKVYEALACHKPVITADTEAVRELLQHRETAYLVPSGDPMAIACAVQDLKADPVLRERLARQGGALFETGLMPQIIVKDLLERLKGGVV